MSKPFDLQKAVEGCKLVTRDGREVSEFYYLKTALIGVERCCYVVSGEIEMCDDKGCWLDWKESGLDLFMKSETVTKWVNVYHSGGKFYHFDANAYETEECAKGFIKENQGLYITTVSVQFEI